MNPMQGQENTGGSSTELNQGDNEPVYSAESSLSTMMNPMDNGTPSGRPNYTSHNWWRHGESSSVSGPSDEVDDIKANHQLQQDGRQLGLNGVMLHAAGYTRSGPAFLRGSSSSSNEHVNMSMDMDNYGSSLGSSVQATGESSSGPASSLDGWASSSCKRKALEATAPSPECVFQTENGASSSLSLATPSQTSFDGTEQIFGTVATNAFHSVRNADTSSRHGRRLNPRQGSVGFSISHSGGSTRPTGSLQLQQSLPSSSGENQTRNIPQFALDSSRGMPPPLWETPRSNPEEEQQAPMFAPESDQSMWSFTAASTIDSGAGGTSSAIEQQQQLWIPPNPSRASQLSPWSLFPSHGASLSVLPTGPSLSSNEPSSSTNSRTHRSRQRRSGLLSDRHNELLHLRHLGRSLAADTDGRNHLISEIRQVLTAMRRGENLRIEDYMVFDPLIFQSMTEMHDRHREMRLDVDNMSYEELLALGERIGDVSTGLREDVILKTMKQHKCTSSSSPELHHDIEPCCICQEEYAAGDDLGTLECGHEFHKDCIKQWVMLKNLCPICKTVALTT